MFVAFNPTEVLKTFSCIVSMHLIQTPFLHQLPFRHQMLLRFLQRKTSHNFATTASHVYLCRKQEPTCSWSGNIHIHDSTVWSLGAKPLEGKEKNVRFVVWCWRRCRYFEYIHLEDIANILCEYRRAETLLHLVVPIDAFVKAGALQQVDNGSKRFPGDVLLYIRLQCQNHDPVKNLERNIPSKIKEITDSNKCVAIFVTQC